MTQLYVLSQDGTSAINLSQFEYVYIGEDNRIKAVNGQKMIRLGDYKSRDGAKFALATMLYYAGKNPGAGWYQMMRGDAAEEHVVRSRDPRSEPICRQRQKARPVRINPHGPEAVWHQEDYDRLAEGIKSGESYMSISKALGKSEKAIRGKVYYCYLTENADKVRAMMAGGNWGDGAPELTVWQARLFSRSRAEMQTTMTMLVEALNCRIRQVGYDPALEDHWNQYWQRTTCLHWDDLKHCTAGCTDCDSCAEYKKIPPQYCARCGATFYERKENTFCLQCRFDRKKQAQRHWCRVNAKRGERP